MVLYLPALYGGAKTAGLQSRNKSFNRRGDPESANAVGNDVDAILNEAMRISAFVRDKILCMRNNCDICRRQLVKTLKPSKVHSREGHSASTIT